MSVSLLNVTLVYSDLESAFKQNIYEVKENNKISSLKMKYALLCIKSLCDSDTLENGTGRRHTHAHVHVGEVEPGPRNKHERTINHSTLYGLLFRINVLI